MKTILITGATDGIGLETTKMLAKGGHKLILHGRSSEKLEYLKQELSGVVANITTVVADFSSLSEVSKMADNILANEQKIDILINNAGVFVIPNHQTITNDGLDVRFSVNTIAPYILTKKLLPILSSDGRVINLASAAQAPVDFDALQGIGRLSDDSAYAQSKLALIMWTISLAEKYPHGPSFIAVNPKSFLGSKMVKTAYGKNGYDLRIGADILCRAALSNEFSHASGRYYDNDYQEFSQPHPFALDASKRQKLIDILEKLM